MSTFIEKLNKIAKAESAGMGFRKASDTASDKKMQVVSCQPLAKAADMAGADAGLLVIEGRLNKEALKSIPKDMIWGAWLKTGGAAEAKTLKDAGCDFVVFSSGTGLSLIGEKDLSKVLEVAAFESDSMLRTLVDLPVEALLVSVDNGGAPLTWQDLMVLKRFGGFPNKPLMTVVTTAVSAPELEALWCAGVKAVITENPIDDMMKEVAKADFKQADEKSKDGPAVRQPGSGFGLRG